MVLELIAGLPRSQRVVITLRDVECWDAWEVCTALGVSEWSCPTFRRRSMMRISS